MILLGNLTVEQMEKRCGITLKDEERNALDALREETCDKVRGNNKMHIYDIPFLNEKDCYLQALWRGGVFRRNALAFRNLLLQELLQRAVGT